MIWTEGETREDDALSIPIVDRSFEHGLGLFETSRTWSGRPTLLDRHRARMLRSARELGLDLDPETLPDAEAVARLIRAEGSDGDRVLRITATGGIGAGRSTVWMRSAPLPAPPADPGATVRVGGWEVVASDPMTRHKALNYWSRRLAFERARAEGCDETLSESGGLIWEGSRTSLFLVVDGELVTPSARGPIVPGVMRALVLEVASERSIPTREVEGIAIAAFQAADEVFLTNAVRGLVPVARARGLDPAKSPCWPAPGPVTRDLGASIFDRLRRGD